MVNFKKVLNLRIISLTMVLLFLFNGVLCAYPFSRTILRVPLSFQEAEERRGVESGYGRFEFLLTLWAGVAGAGKSSGPIRPSTHINHDEGRLSNRLKELGYSPEIIPVIIERFNDEVVLSMSDKERRSLVQAAASAMSRGTVRNFVEALMLCSLTKQLKNFVEQSPLMGSIISGIDPTGVVNRLSDQQRKMRFAKVLRDAVAVAQFYMIFLSDLEVENIEYAVSLRSFFNVIRLENPPGYRRHKADFFIANLKGTNIDMVSEDVQDKGDVWVLIMNFARRTAIYLNLSNVYKEGENGYWTLKPEFRITPNNARLSDLLRKVKSGKLNLNSSLQGMYISEQEVLLLILNAHYPYLKMGDKGILKAALCRNIGAGISAELGRFEEERRCYEQALILDPASAETYFYLGAAAARPDLEYILEIRAVLAKTQQEDITSAIRTKLESELEKLCRRYLDFAEQPIRYYTKAIELYPGYAPAYLERGKLHCSTGVFSDVQSKGEKFNKALEDFKKVAELEPCNARAYLEIGRVYYQYKVDTDLAVQHFAMALLLDPEIYKEIPDVSSDMQLKIEGQRKRIIEERNARSRRAFLAPLILPLRSTLPANRPTGL